MDVDAPDSGSVWADPDLLRRVMDNLIDNAIRHTPEGTAVKLTGAPTSGGWNIDVQDQGPGVPEAIRPMLFERFAGSAARPRDSAGAGLGLALSRAIAESHGGSLRLVEQNGPGATFRLFFPDSPSPARGGGQGGASFPGAPGQPRESSGLCAPGTQQMKARSWTSLCRAGHAPAGSQPHWRAL
jgi:K+-sensing histidine kinase KdpD